TSDNSMCVVIGHEWCDCYVVFFFQAEDGIRDRTVTGVQTCLFRSAASARPTRRTPGSRGSTRRSRCTSGAASPSSSEPSLPSRRSEERRVGKECRSRRAPCREGKEV